MFLLLKCLCYTTCIFQKGVINYMYLLGATDNNAMSGVGEFFSKIFNEISALWYWPILLLSIMIAAIIVTGILIGLSYENKILKSINKINTYFLSKPFITEENLVEFNLKMKKVPKVLRNNWQIYMLNREDAPTTYINVNTCIDKPLRTSSIEKNMSNFTIFTILLACLSFFVGLQYARSSEIISASLGLTIFYAGLVPLGILVLYVIAIFIAKAIKDDIYSSMYDNFPLYERNLTKAVSTLPSYVDYEILFTRKEIKEGIPILQQYLEKRALVEQQELEKARADSAACEEYDFGELGIDGSLVLERAMKESETFIRTRNRLQEECGQIEVERENYKKTFEQNEKDYQRKLQASRENLESLKAQQEASTNRIESNYIRKQQSDEIKKQEQLEKDNDEANAKYNEEQISLQQEIDKRKQEIEERKAFVQQAMLLEFKHYANTLYKALTQRATELGNQKLITLAQENSDLKTLLGDLQGTPYEQGNPQENIIQNEEVTSENLYAMSGSEVDQMEQNRQMSETYSQQEATKQTKQAKNSQNQNVANNVNNVDNSNITDGNNGNVDVSGNFDGTTDGTINANGDINNANGNDADGVNTANFNNAGYSNTETYGANVNNYVDNGYNSAESNNNNVNYSNTDINNYNAINGNANFNGYSDINANNVNTDININGNNSDTDINNNGNFDGNNVIDGNGNSNIDSNGNIDGNGNLGDGTDITGDGGQTYDELDDIQKQIDAEHSKLQQQKEEFENDLTNTLNKFGANEEPFQPEVYSQPQTMQNFNTQNGVMPNIASQNYMEQNYGTQAIEENNLQPINEEPQINLDQQPVINEETAQQFASEEVAQPQTITTEPVVEQTQPVENESAINQEETPIVDNENAVEQSAPAVSEQEQATNNEANATQTIDNNQENQQGLTTSRKPVFDQLNSMINDSIDEEPQTEVQPIQAEDIQVENSQSEQQEVKPQTEQELKKAQQPAEQEETKPKTEQTAKTNAPQEEQAKKPAQTKKPVLEEDYDENDAPAKTRGTRQSSASNIQRTPNRANKTRRVGGTRRANSEIDALNAEMQKLLDSTKK